MLRAIQRLRPISPVPEKFLGAGLGIPGIIDLQTGMLRKFANLPGFEEISRARRNRAPSGVPEKRGPRKSSKTTPMSPRSAKHGSARLAASPTCRRTLGTGIGGGIVLQGKIWHGMNGMAGEFGHVTLEPSGHPCGLR